MDQVTQAVLGGVAAQIVCGRSLGKRAWVVGAVAGVLPDADLALSGFADPAFPIEMHRTWTHALAVTPLGALLTTLLFLPRRAYRERWRLVYLAAFVGWFTHGPLDACTSYGTKIWLPFSDAWVAWDLISIIDPLFTVVLIVGLVLAVRRARLRPAVIALTICLVYLGLGMIQRNRALGVQRQLAEARGDPITHGRVIPALGSIVIWRGMYWSLPPIILNRSDGPYLTVDALVLPPIVEARVQAQGARTVSLVSLMSSDDDGWEDSLRGRYIKFADGFAVVDWPAPGEPRRLGDVRYTVDYGFDAVWGIEIGEGGQERWFDQRRQWGRRMGTVIRHSLGLEGTWVPLDQELQRARTER